MKTIIQLLLLIAAFTCSAQPINPAVVYPIALNKGGLGVALTDPNADRLMFWDDSCGCMAWLTAGGGLSISGTTISSNLNRVEKTSDEARTNTTTLAADSQLVFPMQANTTYTATVFAVFNCNNAPDIKFALNGPASPTALHYRAITSGPNQSITNVNYTYPYAYGVSTTICTTTSGYGSIEYSVWVQNGANAGNFELQWAQNSSSATASSVLAGSYIEYYEQ